MTEQKYLYGVYRSYRERRSMLGAIKILKEGAKQIRVDACQAKALAFMEERLKSKVENLRDKLKAAEKELQEFTTIKDSLDVTYEE